LPEKKNNIWAERLLRLLPKRLRTPNILEFIRYAVIGTLTFLLNNGLFNLLHSALHWEENLSNVISVFVSVVFAYLGSKWFVFLTHCKDKRALLREAFSFFSARAVTMVIEIGGLYLLVTRAGLPAVWIKLGLTVLVILLNYIFSKLFVFRKILG